MVGCPTIRSPVHVPGESADGGNLIEVDRMEEGWGVGDWHGNEVYSIIIIVIIISWGLPPVGFCGHITSATYVPLHIPSPAESRPILCSCSATGTAIPPTTDASRTRPSPPMLDRIPWKRSEEDLL